MLFWGIVQVLYTCTHYYSLHIRWGPSVYPEYFEQLSPLVLCSTNWPPSSSRFHFNKRDCYWLNCEFSFPVSLPGNSGSYRTCFIFLPSSQSLCFAICCPFSESCFIDFVHNLLFSDGKVNLIPVTSYPGMETLTLQN